MVVLCVHACVYVIVLFDVLVHVSLIETEYFYIILFGMSSLLITMLYSVVLKYYTQIMFSICNR